MAWLPTVRPQTEGGGVWKPLAVTHFLEVLGTGLQTPTAQPFGEASLGQAPQFPRNRGWVLIFAGRPPPASLRLSLSPVASLRLLSPSFSLGLRASLPTSPT